MTIELYLSFKDAEKQAKRYEEITQGTIKFKPIKVKITDWKTLYSAGGTIILPQYEGSFLERSSDEQDLKDFQEEQKHIYILISYVPEIDIDWRLEWLEECGLKVVENGN